MLGVSELGSSRFAEAEYWERWDEVLVGFDSRRFDQAMRKRGGLDSRMMRRTFGLGLECIFGWVRWDQVSCGGIERRRALS